MAQAAGFSLQKRNIIAVAETVLMKNGRTSTVLSGWYFIVMDQKLWALTKPHRNMDPDTFYVSTSGANQLCDTVLSEDFRPKLEKASVNLGSLFENTVPGLRGTIFITQYDDSGLICHMEQDGSRIGEATMVKSNIEDFRKSLAKQTEQ